LRREMSFGQWSRMVRRWIEVSRLVAKNGNRPCNQISLLYTCSICFPRPSFDRQRAPSISLARRPIPPGLNLLKNAQESLYHGSSRKSSPMVQKRSPNKCITETQKPTEECNARLFGRSDINTANSTGYTLDVAVDGELTSCQGTNHEQTCANTGV